MVFCRRRIAYSAWAWSSSITRERAWWPAARPASLVRYSIRRGSENVDSCSLTGWFDSVLSSGSFVICMIPTIGPDPLHFDTDMDPNPWIRTLDYRSGSGFCSFWQLLSSSQQKMSFLSSFLLSSHSWFPGFRIRIDLMRIRIRIRIQHFF